MTKRLRQLYIDSIMINKYGDDDPKYDESNRKFLNGLSDEELENFSDEVIVEEEY